MLIYIKPHHFIDIVTAVGRGELSFSPHPYGHAQHTVAARIISHPDILLEIDLGADDICKPCKNNIDGKCVDTIDTSFRPQAPKSKQEWNYLIDCRWCDHLKLRTGDQLTAREFLQRLRNMPQDIAAVYQEIPEKQTEDRSQKLIKGIETLLLFSIPMFVFTIFDLFPLRSAIS